MLVVAKYFEGDTSYHTFMIRQLLNGTYLDVFSESSEDLLSNTDGADKVQFSSFINSVFAGVVPIEIHHRFLNTQQIIYCTDDQIYCCVISYLCSQVILPI